MDRNKSQGRKCLRGCSIITSHIGGGWVAAFFGMLRDGKQGG